MKIHIAAFAFVGMLLSGTLVTAGEAEKQRLLSEYPAAAKRLQDRYSQVKGTLTLRENLIPGATETRTSRVTFAVDAGRHKLERQSTRQLVPSGRQESTNVVCFGPEDAFTLLRPDRGKPFELNGRDREKAQRPFHRECGNNVFSPFQFSAHPLTYFLDELTLSAVEPLPAKEGGGLRVSLKAKNDLPIYVDVDPDQGWVIRRVEVLVGPSPQGITPTAKPLNALTTIDYQGKDSVTGLPLPKTIRQFRMSNLVSTATIDSLRFEPTPAAEFTLAHYGLSAQAQAPKAEAETGAGGPPSGRLVPWLAGLGIIGLGAAMGLYRLAARPRARRSGDGLGDDRAITPSPSSP